MSLFSLFPIKSNGISSFPGISIDKGGTGYTITAAAGGLTGAISAAFNIASGAAGKLVFIQQPTDAVSTTAINPAVTVAFQDNGGNIVTTSTAPVTIAISTNPASGILSGTLTVNAVAGLATFSDLSIDKVGTGYTLKASTPSVQDATSGPFNITLGAARKLGFVQQPTGTTVATAIVPAITVAIQDNGGNTVTTSSTTVTMVIGTNPGSGVLGGTLVASSVNDVATFSGLSINQAGTGYSLTASAPSLTSAASALFNIGAPAPLPIVIPTTCLTLGYKPNDKVRLFVSGNETTSGSVPVVICYTLLSDPVQVGVTQSFSLAVDVVAFTTANTSVAP